MERQGLNIHMLPSFIPQASPGKVRVSRGKENKTTSALRRALCGEFHSGNWQGWWGLVSPGATPKPGPQEGGVGGWTSMWPRNGQVGGEGQQTGWSGLRTRVASHRALYPSPPGLVQGVLAAFLNMEGIVLFPGAAISTASLLPVCLALRDHSSPLLF